MARSLLFQGSLPMKFWGECVLAATYLINRTPSKLLEGKTPHETLFSEKLLYDYIKTFGTLCFAQTKKTKDKFVSKGRKCVFMDYPFAKKGWRLFDLETQEFIVNRDVIFHEHILSLCTKNEPTRHLPSS